MRVIVNGVTRVLAVEPEQTLLDSLRLDLGLKGTKEGCRSGDCGACTVLVRQSAASPFYPVNSCILPLAQLQDQEVLTIEGLAIEGQLHPVQAALIDYHGSQCGFCTPGFVMAIAGWLDLQNHRDGEGRHVDAKASTPVENDPASAALIKACQEAIAGNLCRCTGYRPIIEAACVAAQGPLPELATIAASQATLASDRAITSDNAITNPAVERSLMANASQSPKKSETADLDGDRIVTGRRSLGVGEFYEPEDLDALQSVLSARPHATLLAGGTDLMLGVTQSGDLLGDVVSLAKVQALKAIQLGGGTGVIGAGATYSEVLAATSQAWPALHHFLFRLGSPQIRNQGTIGGNLGTASPIGDMLPILLAMDAKVRIGNAQGMIRQLPLESFIQGYRQTALEPGEFLFDVRVEGLDDFHRYYKVSKRQEDDISSVSVAVRAQIEIQHLTDVRIAVGGVADRALRLLDIESAFSGKTLTDASVLDVHSMMREAISPISDVRASAAYRTAVTASLITRAMLEAAGTPMATIYEGLGDA